MTDSSHPEPRLYGDLAGWFHLLTHPDDYEEEAGIYAAQLRDAAAFEPKTLLELGSGGGNNASHMKAWFELTLTDLSPEMLAVSQRLNPEVEHIQGDMRTLRLGREFDAAFAHDAVSYLADEESVRQSIQTVWVHLRPGGSVLFAPDATAERFREIVEEGGHDGDDGRALRYLAWTHRRGIEAPRYYTDFAYLLMEADGSVRSVYDRHVEGAHSEETWMRAFADAGFEAVQMHELQHSEVEPGTLVHFVARKPASPG